MIQALRRLFAPPPPPAITISRLLMVTRYPLLSAITKFLGRGFMLFTRTIFAAVALARHGHDLCRVLDHVGLGPGDLD